MPTTNPAQLEKANVLSVQFRKTHGLVKSVFQYPKNGKETVCFRTVADGNQQIMGIRVKIQGIETFCFFSELDFVFLSLEAHEWSGPHPVKPLKLQLTKQRLMLLNFSSLLISH